MGEVTDYVKLFGKTYKKIWNQFLKPDFKPQSIHHFFTDFNLVYIYGKDFSNGLRIYKLIVDGAIFYRRICKRVIKMYEKKLNHF